MVKKLDIEALDIGMYVVNLDRPWLERPYLLHSRKIKNKKNIDKLKSSGIKYVFIDTMKGKDSRQAIAIKERENNIKKLFIERFKKQKKEIPGPNDEDFHNELDKAMEVKAEANKVIKGLLKDVRLGKNADREKIYSLVDQMVMSSLRNPDVLLSLALLRNYDNNTFIHLVNVGCLAISFGHFLGLEKNQLFQLGLGGILHDIGKIMVPQNILKNSSPLLEEEFDILKLHVNQGIEYLSKNCKINAESINFVSEHHERWDGSGYPMGLKKNNISVFGQIGGILDAYDVMTRGRAYCKKMNHFDAMKLLYEFSDTMFNKFYVEKFVECMGVYPAGSLVRLNNNKLAYVWKTHHQALLRPTVIVFYDLSSGQYLAPQRTNLGLPQHENLGIASVLQS